MAFSAYLNRDISEKEIEYVVYQDEYGNPISIATHTSIEKFAISQGLKIEYSGEIATEGYYKVTCTVSDGVRTVTKIGENTDFALKRDDERQRSFSWREFPLTKAYNMALDRAVLAFYSIEGRVYSDTELDRSTFKKAEVAPAPAPKKRRKAVSEDSVSAEEIPVDSKKESKVEPVSEEVAVEKPEEVVAAPKKSIAEATEELENNPAVMEAFDEVRRKAAEFDEAEPEAEDAAEEAESEKTTEAVSEETTEEPAKEAPAEENDRSDEGLIRYVNSSERYQEENLHIASTECLDTEMNFGRYRGSGRTMRSLFYEDDEYLVWMTKRMIDNDSVNAIRKTFGIE